MNNFNLYFLIFIYFSCRCFAKISDKRLCADLECKTPISSGKIVLNYLSTDPLILSCKSNDDVVIFSKSAGSNADLWGVEIDKQRGYLNKIFIRELKVFVSKPNVLVDTELRDENESQKIVQVDPRKVENSYEVIEGTTIYNTQTEYSTEQAQTINQKFENITHSHKEDVLNLDHSSKDIKNVAANTSNTQGNSSIYENQKVPDINKSDQKTADTNGIRQLRNTENFENALVTDNTVSENIVGTDELKNDSNTEPSINSFFPKFYDSVSEKKNSIEEEIQINSNENSQEFSKIDKANKDNVDNPNKIDNNGKTLNVSSEINPIENEFDKNGSNENKDSIVVTEQTENKINVDFKEASNIQDIKIKSNLESIETLSNSSENNSSESELDSNNNKEKIKDFNQNTDNSDVKDVKSNENNNIDSKNSSGVNELKNEPVNNNIYIENLKNLNLNAVNSDVKDVKSSENNNIDSTNSSEVNELKNEPVGNNIYNENLKNLNLNIVSSNVKDVKSSENNNIDSTNSSEVNELKNEPVGNNIYSENLKNLNLNTVNSDVKGVKSNENNNIDDNYSNKKMEDLDQDQDKSNNISTENTLFTKEPDRSQIDLSKVENEIPDQSIPSNKIEVLPNLEQQYLEKPKESSETSQEVEMNLELESLNKQDHDTIQSSISSEASSEGNGALNNIFSKLEIGNGKNFKNMERYESENADDKFNLEEASIPDDQDVDIALDSEKLCSSDSETCSDNEEEEYLNNFFEMDLNLSQDLLVFLSTTAISVIVLFLGYVIIDKNRREAPLIAKVNKLEKELLIVLKEKEALQDQNLVPQENVIDSSEYINLQQQLDQSLREKKALEDQIQTLEKELENSTEVGLELNRMLSELINSDNVGETLKNTVEDLQLQLAEQQNIVSSMKEKLNSKETENHEIRLELEINIKKVSELQAEIDKMLSNIIKIEEEKTNQQRTLEKEMSEFKQKADYYEKEFNLIQKEYGTNMQKLNEKLTDLEHNLELKIREYESLKETLKGFEDNGKNINEIVEVTSLKAQLEQFQTECKSQKERLKMEIEYKVQLETAIKTNEAEINELKNKYDAIDKTKLELETKLQVLSSYFKEREAQLQKEVEKYEEMWSERKGEATSTSERMKYMQTEIQNYRAQNESLKEEIVAQEVELKSQISVLEKKVHENWVNARQAERKLEDLRQEATQLRNRLTLKERAILGEKNRVQSPLDSAQMEHPSSPPPLLFNRDLSSPPLPGLPPPPFLHPPPGAPFLSMPLPFMPPPPNMGFPGDHRPPPLGRMSSPPLDRYSPDPRLGRPYSPNDDDQRSPSPSYDDESEYGTSPVHRRYRPYIIVKHYHTPPEGKLNGRMGKDGLSSGSANSNDSLDKIYFQ